MVNMRNNSDISYMKFAHKGSQGRMIF